MLRALSRSLLAPAMGLGVLSFGACGERREASREAPAADTTATAPVPSGTETGQAATRLTDANIVALLDEANKADSTAGALAATKATSPAVKDFAKLMMVEHHALRQAGQQLAKQLKVTPEPPANNPLTPLVESETTALNSTPKGPEFDRTYIDQEITAHKAVLDLASEAHEQAQNEQLKALIEKAKPVIQKHLDKAEKIKEELGKTTT
jgi:putative membrane protein